MKGLLDNMERHGEREHASFDFKAAAKLFKGKRELDGEQICGPFSLFSVETLRDKFDLRAQRGVPTDVFVWGLGSTGTRHLTKVSGLPYWPKSKPWPKSKSGRNLRFLAQFNFRDSRDITLELPGDLLLLFVPDDNGEWLFDPITVYFEWLRIEDTPLLSRFPKGVKSYADNEWYGVIFRTSDYPSASVDESQVRYNPQDIPIINGTKIGGFPNLIQADDDTVADLRRGQFFLRQPKARFLCQLTSFQPALNVEYPWINVRDPLPQEQMYSRSGKDTSSLIFGDMGSVYIYVEPNGKCHPRFSDY